MSETIISLEDDRPMTNSEVVKEFHVSPRTILRLQNEGVLPYWIPNGVTRPRMMWRSTVVDWRLGRNG